MEKENKSELNLNESLILIEEFMKPLGQSIYKKEFVQAKLKVILDHMFWNRFRFILQV